MADFLRGSLAAFCHCRKELNMQSVLNLIFTESFELSGSWQMSQYSERVRRKTLVITGC